MPNKADDLRFICDCVADLDSILSLATCADDYQYVRPQLDNSTDILIEAGRHPLLDISCDQANGFIPNDTIMAPKQVCATNEIAVHSYVEP
jgi:DNA mismatch repair protein MutS